MFRAFFSDISGRPPAGNGAPFLDIGVRNWRLDLDFHTSWEPHAFNEPKTAAEQHKPHLPSTAVPNIVSPRARVRHHHEPMESGSDGVDHKSLASVLAVAIAAFTKLNHNLSRRGQGQLVSGRI